MLALRKGIGPASAFGTRLGGDPGCGDGRGDGSWSPLRALVCPRSRFVHHWVAVGGGNGTGGGRTRGGEGEGEGEDEGDGRDEKGEDEGGDGDEG